MYAPTGIQNESGDSFNIFPDNLRKVSFIVILREPVLLIDVTEPARLSAPACSCKRAGSRADGESAWNDSSRLPACRENTSEQAGRFTRIRESTVRSE